MAEEKKHVNRKATNNGNNIFRVCFRRSTQNETCKNTTTELKKRTKKFRHFFFFAFILEMQAKWMEWRCTKPLPFGWVKGRAEFWTWIKRISVEWPLSLPKRNLFFGDCYSFWLCNILFRLHIIKMLNNLQEMNAFWLFLKYMCLPQQPGTRLIVIARSLAIFSTVEKRLLFLFSRLFHRYDDGISILP